MIESKSVSSILNSQSIAHEEDPYKNHISVDVPKIKQNASMFKKNQNYLN